MSTEIPRCTSICKNGKPCSAYQKKGVTTCGRHTPFPEDAECPICYETVTRKESKVLKCNHMFHSACIQRWLGEMHKDTCPTCRAVIRTRRKAQVAQALVPVYRQTGRFVFVAETDDGVLWEYVDETGAMGQMILVN